MTLKEQIEALLTEKRTPDTIKRMFQLHNEHFSPKHTAYHCSGCVKKVLNRLNNYVTYGI
jgi:predicted Zn-ribbon and HTH transcriptional regulator